MASTDDTTPAHERTESGASLDDFRASLRELNEEWETLREALASLQALLSPEDFRAALDAAGLAPPETSLSTDDTPEAPGARPGDEPGSRASRPPASASEADPSSTPAPSDAEATGDPPPDASPQGGKEQIRVKDDLAELIALLKKNLASKDQSVGELTFPPHITLEIAREVARRVKESVGAGSRLAQDSPGDHEEGAPPAERIPIHDVAAILDHLNKRN